MDSTNARDIAGFHCHIIIKTIKQIKSTIKEIFKQSHKGSGLCDVSCGRYSKKCFTQIYKTLYGDDMFVSFSGAQKWRPEADKNICHRVLL